MGHVSAALSPVLNTTLVIFNSKENGSYDEGEENVDSQLHREKHQTLRQKKAMMKICLVQFVKYVSGCIERKLVRTNV